MSRKNKRAKVVYGESSKRKPRAKEHTMRMSISVSNVEDQVAAFLYSIGVVKDNEKIGPITWGEITKDPETGVDVIPIEFTVRKEASTKIG